MAKDESRASFSDANISFSAEIIPGRLYLTVLKTQLRPKYTQLTHYFSVDDELKYEPFYDDFGPLNLAQVHRYCHKLNDKLASPTLKKKKIVHFTGCDPRKKVNGAFLMGTYMVLYLNWDPADAVTKLRACGSFWNFRDASVGTPHFTISLSDCLHAMARAKECGFYNPNDFSIQDYVHYETVENGDLNWIVPEKFVAFAGPQSLEYRLAKWHQHPLTTHTPESYIKYFNDLKVTAVVRLNSRCYESSKFTAAGIKHYDLIFVDGGIPSDDLVDYFLKIAEMTEGAVAVHCKAGLGRTGSMIGCYIMKWYRFTARQTIAWLRICRPASIIGHQQHWLERQQVTMWMAGLKVSRPIHEFGVYSRERGSILHLVSRSNSSQSSSDSLSGITSQVTTMHLDTADVNKNTEDDVTQGDQLQKIKMDRANSSRSLRLSWPLTGKRCGTGWPMPSAAPVSRRTALSKVSIKRASLRKRNCPTPKTSDEKLSQTPTADVTPSVPLRRSPRTVETRLTKSVVLR